MAEAEHRRFRRVAWANVLGNAAKIAVEGVVGLLFGSVALVADAAHSVVDLIGSMLVLGWGDAGYRAPDSEHPHGHARFEPMTALAVGASIVVMGGLLLYQSIEGLRRGSTIAFDYAMLGALVFAIGSMGLLYRYTIAENEILQSSALHALAVDSRNDILTSGAALVGVLGIFAGYSVFDPLAGGLVSVLVIAQGISVGRENVGYLLGRGAPADKREEVRAALLAHPAVAGVHDFVVFYEGATLEVEAHVEVDGEMQLRRAHEIESELVRTLQEIKGVGDAHVHLDPSGIGEWKDAAD